MTMARPTRPRMRRRTANSISTAIAPRKDDLLNEYAMPASSTTIATRVHALVIPWRPFGSQASSTARASTKSAPWILWFKAPV